MKHAALTPLFEFSYLCTEEVPASPEVVSIMAICSVGSLVPRRQGIRVNRSDLCSRW